jgi:GGDEF domain-containing protein
MKTPQQLSRKAIDEFKAIYLDEFGHELSDDEVQEIAMRLLRFFGILAKPGGARD